MGQRVSFRMVAEKVLAKGKKLCAAFKGLEKAYDRVDWLALWDVLRLYGMGGKLLNAIKSSVRMYLYVSNLVEKQVNILR